MSSAHDIGDAVRLWAVFRDEAGAQAAPTAVTLYVRDPADGTSSLVANEAAVAGDVVTAAADLGVTLADETGLYKAIVSPDSAGWWRYRWNGTGAVVDVEPGWFEVRRQLVDAP